MLRPAPLLRSLELGGLESVEHVLVPRLVRVHALLVRRAPNRRRVVSYRPRRRGVAPALFGISQATGGLGTFEEVAVLKTGAAFSLGLVSFSFVPALVRAPSAKYFLWLSVIFFRSGLVEHLCHVGHYNLLSVAPHGDPAGALPTGVE